MICASCGHLHPKEVLGEEYIRWGPCPCGCTLYHPTEASKTSILQNTTVEPVPPEDDDGAEDCS